MGSNASGRTRPASGNGNAEVGYRILAKTFHPDHGGTNEQMAELNAAIAVLRKE